MDLESSVLLGLGLCLWGIPASITAPQADKVIVKDPHVSSIMLAFEPGMVRTPIWYAITLNDDGTATYSVNGFSKLNGAYRAQGLNREFHRLSDLVRSSQYTHLDSYYGPAATDIPEVRVSVTTSGKRKTVVDWGRPIQPKYEKEAPKVLKQVEKGLMDLVQIAHWAKTYGKPDIPRYLPSDDGKG